MDYLISNTLEEAFSILTQYGSRAKILAGGTDLIPRLRAGQPQPDLLLDISRLRLNYVRRWADELLIGAGVTHTKILASPLISAFAPALADACRQVAAPPIRNRGTLGGNLVNASPAADTAPVLLVYDAGVVLASAGGTRCEPLAGFFTGPGKTLVQPNELLTEIRLPVPAPHTAAAFIKLGKRQAMAIAIASAAVRITLDDRGCVASARVALGSVAPTPILVPEAALAIAGQPLSTGLASVCAAAAAQAAHPIDDIRATAAYRREVVPVLVRRAVRQVVAALQEQTA